MGPGLKSLHTAVGARCQAALASNRSVRARVGTGRPSPFAAVVRLVDEGEDGVRLVVVFLDEQGIAATEELAADPVGDAQENLLVAAVDRGDAIHGAGGLPVRASAGVVAPLLDGAAAAPFLLGLRFLVQALARRFVDPTVQGPPPLRIAVATSFP